MKIYIKYIDNKFLINTKNYESINSIIFSCINENISLIKNNNNNDFILDSDGIILNKNYSLEKYNIKENSVLNLYPKLKGGNSFFSFIFSHPLIAFISFIIVIIPIFVLPLGFTSVFASFLEIIIIPMQKTILFKAGILQGITMGNRI